MQLTSPFGAPAAASASERIRTVSWMHSLAFGCGENMMAFPAFRAISVLKITVDVGLVEGISPAITPTGTATSISLLLSSSLRIPTVRSPRIASVTVWAAKRFLSVLSRHFPNPVSSWAIFASLSALPAAARATASTRASTSACPMAPRTFWAALAAATRSRAS